MKKIFVVPGTLALAVIAGLGWFGFGCGKPSGTLKTGSSPASAERTSFAEVTSQLDPGGNFYLYLGTAQWLAHLSSGVESWRSNVTALPGVTAENTGEINQAFDVVGHVIQDSGIEDITGVGLSSVEIEKGMFRNKMLLHHYPGSGAGFFWKLCGQEPHALAGLDLLPSDTALAVFTDLDLRLLWKVTQDEVAKSGIPQAQDFIAKLPAQFEKQTKLKWDAVVNSLSGEAGFILTLNESNMIPIPLPGNALTVPEPGLMLVFKVNDDTLFDRLDQELKANPDTTSVDEKGLRMRTMNIPLPFIGTLRPSAASSGGYLFIASSDTLVTGSLAVKSGKTPGLKSTAEFKQLAKNIPDQGNQFVFMSERFGHLLFQIQQQATLGQLAKNSSSPAQSQWMSTLFQNQHPAFAYSVSANTPQGRLTVGNSSQSFANMALIPAVAVPAMLSAIAIPNFVKARSTSQQNACINNLRQIDAAKAQWVLEKHKSSNAVPTQPDITPYLYRWPVCPAGGTYTIGRADVPPKCTVAGHVLP